MLGPALDPNDPFSAMLMNGSENFMSSPYSPWGTQQIGKSSHPVSMHPSYDGMSATLAPSALENSPESLSATPASKSTLTGDGTSAPSSGFDFSFGQELTMGNGGAQGLASGQITPGEGFWDSFVQENGWSEEAVPN